jgi:HEPN domain-containing protein
MIKDLCTYRCIDTERLSLYTEGMNRYKDWFEQGKRDLERARIDLEHEYFEWACFTSQQAGEKLLKAVALKNGFAVWGHSLTEITSILAQKMEIPAPIKENAQILDLFYIAARYPNGFPSGKPADYFTEKQAKEAIDAADNICAFSRSHLS